MHTTTGRPTHFALLLAICALALGGCAAPAEVPKGDYPELTLAESKSPVQLSRNGLGTRIPSIVVESIDETVDTSVPCLTDEEDPKQFIRMWTSSFEATIVSGSAWRVVAIASNLVQSYTDDGWTATPQGDGTLVSNPGGSVEMLITPTPVSDSEAHITVEAHGPCVVTDGVDSEELATLHNKP